MSNKGKKFVGVLEIILGVMFFLFGLLFLVILPMFGVFLIVLGAIYFFLGRKYSNKHKKKAEQSKNEVSNITIDTETKEKTQDIKCEKTTVNPTISSHEAQLIENAKKRFEQCVYDCVVIDFETTGLNYPDFDRVRYDEILSVSIIDQDGNVLLNSLCKPQHRKSWTRAQEIHGISPAMVKNKPTFEELFPTIKEILCKSKLVIAYNIDFEMNFLLGFDYLFGFPSGSELRESVVWGPDPMLMYCAYKGIEKWQKLSTVAKHFKFDFNAHDSLEDVKATLHCYKKLLEYVNSNPDKSYILKYGYLYDKGKYCILTGNQFD